MVVFEIFLELLKHVVSMQLKVAFFDTNGWWIIG